MVVGQAYKSAPLQITDDVPGGIQRKVESAGHGLKGPFLRAAVPQQQESFEVRDRVDLIENEYINGFSCQILVHHYGSETLRAGASAWDFAGSRRLASSLMAALKLRGLETFARLQLRLNQGRNLSHASDDSQAIGELF